MVTGRIFDVRAFNPFAPSNRSFLKSTYEKHKREKRRAYEECVIQIEHESFTPLVFSACGGMGPAVQVVYNLLQGKLAEKRGAPYQRTVSRIRCMLRFSLLRWAIRWIRGSWSTYKKPRIDTTSVDLLVWLNLNAWSWILLFHMQRAVCICLLFNMLFVIFSEPDCLRILGFSDFQSSQHCREQWTGAKVGEDVNGLL